MKRAVFLDRDGTLNIECSYLSDPAKLTLFPDVIPSLKRLRDRDFLLFIVTNQSGIGRGYYSLEDMHAVNSKLVAITQQEGIHIEEIYFAPEAPEDPSYGRKPSPQFLLDAAQAYDIDLGRSFMVGDKLSDVQCGWNAKVQTSILLKTGYGQKVIDEAKVDLSQAIIADTRGAATDYIIAK